MTAAMFVKKNQSQALTAHVSPGLEAISTAELLVTRQKEPQSARPQADIFFEKLGKTTHPRARGFFHKLDSRKKGDRGRMEAWNPAVVAQWEAEGRGTYAVINDGGDTDESIIHCNATFGEWDNKARAEQAAFDWLAAGLPKPTMAIWTSQAVDASLHFYWCYTAPLQDVMRWRLMQWRIIQLLQSDPSIENPSRIMRVPGCAYPGKGVTEIDYTISTGVKIDFMELEARVGQAEQARGLIVAGAVPESAWKRFGEELEGRLQLQRPVVASSNGTGPAAASSEARSSSAQQSTAPAIAYSENTIDDIKEALSCIPPRGVIPGTYQRDRNIVWGLAAALEAIGRPREEAAALVKAAGWKDWDVEQVVGSGGELVKQSTFWYHAKQAGYKSRKRRLPQVAAMEEAAEAEVKASELALAEQQLRDAIDLPVLEQRALIKKIADETGLYVATLEKVFEQLASAEQDNHAIQEEVEALAREKENAKTLELLELDYLLPKKIAEAIGVVTEFLPCNPVSAAVLYLTGQSSLLPLGSRLTAVAVSDMVVPLNLFSVLVAKTGSKKTPLKKAVLDGPLASVREQAEVDYQEKMNKWKAKFDHPDVKEEERDDQPVRVLVQVSKATPEALSQQMMFQEKEKRGLLLLRDEFSGLIGSIGQYQQSGKGDGMQQLLELYDGGGEDSVYKTIETVSYRSSHLCICSNSQPSVIEDYMKAGDAKGQWARFCMVPMPSTTKKLPAEDTSELEARLGSAKAYLQKISLEMYATPIRELRFDPKARANFAEYEEREAARAINHDNAVGALHNKSGGKVARLAGILHYLALAEEKLNLDSEEKPKVLRDPYTVSAKDLERACNLVDAMNRWMVELVGKMDREAEGGGILGRVLAMARRRGRAVTCREIFTSQTKKERQGPNRINAQAIKDAFVALVEAGKGTLDDQGRFKAN